MDEISPATLVDGSCSQTLRVRVDHSIRGLHLRLATSKSGRLTSVYEREVEHQLHRTMRGRSILTADNPLLTPAEREKLDAQGLIRPGAVLDEQTVLASILRTFEVDVGRPPPAAGMVRAEDDSPTWPFGWDGAVVASASYESHSPMGVELPKNLVGQINVRLRLVLPIGVGDVLLLRGHPFVITNVIESGNADVIVDASVGRLLELCDGESTEVAVSVGSQPARWAIAARPPGPCSLITHRPLRRYSTLLTPSHAHTLRESGMTANLAELVTLKSDDISGRNQLDAALRGEADFPIPGTPETFRVLLAEFATLGLNPRVRGSTGSTELLLTPMTDVDRMVRSWGSIDKAETIHFRTLKPTPQGLFCEETFGSDDSTDRRTRFGHIQLPDPVVPWIFHARIHDGAPSILSHVLKISDDEIAGLLDYELWLSEEAGISSGEAPLAGQLTGPLAIERLLNNLPDEAIPGWLRGSSQPRSALVARTILVLPPDLRPLIPLQNGNSATSDLNDQYRRVIDRANRLRKLKELNAPEIIVRNELRMLQGTTDCLFANTFLPRARQVPDSRGGPLKDLLHFALTRLREEEAKPVDYSGFARAVVSVAAKPDTVVMPQEMAEVLKLRPLMPVLVTRQPRTGEFAAPILPLRTTIHEHPVIGLHPKSYDALFSEPASTNECQVHRPMTPPAVEEATGRIGQLQSASTPPRESWLDATDPRVLLDTLLDATTRRERVSFGSPRGIVLAGPGSAKIDTSGPPSPASSDRVRPPKTASIEIPITWADDS